MYWNYWLLVRGSLPLLWPWHSYSVPCGKGEFCLMIKCRFRTIVVTFTYVIHIVMLRIMIPCTLVGGFIPAVWIAKMSPWAGHGNLSSTFTWNPRRLSGQFVIWLFLCLCHKERAMLVFLLCTAQGLLLLSALCPLLFLSCSRADAFFREYGSHGPVEASFFLPHLRLWLQILSSMIHLFSLLHNHPLCRFCHLYPEVGGSVFFWNVGTHLPD